ncbi:MAG: hypothetical protein ACD_15C00026G0001 [uncultured bacterium]|nr:MAG: hypothetical protein ACD_15C00026G0001 [uncultured bacterium]HCU70310.1 peptide chain release factor N(5)-glutamine methyltransferase [Candidatus Moranbacteria bacterium]
MKTTIAGIQKEYLGKIDHLDLELIIAHAIKKPREFVLIHPEFALTKNQELQTKNLLARRIKEEPLAYILGSREFFSLPFLVSPATLIPRPETELMVETALEELPASPAGKLKTIIDVGTGSGNIIVSIAANYKPPASPAGRQTTNYFAIDISKEALKIAKKNAKLNEVSEKIKFLHGSLLEPFIKNIFYKLTTTNHKLIILANLPYLSKEIYSATQPTVKKYEPKPALYSAKAGLAHYEKLLKQIKSLRTTNHKLQTTLMFEISPEQKTKIFPLIKKYFPEARIEFKKDLAQKWRICKIEI